MTQVLPGEFCLVADKTALFLDFDGTLSPLQDDPDQVHLTNEQSEIILACAGRLQGALAIISGRDIHDLCLRAPEAIWRLGNHGLFRAAPYQTPQTSDATPPAELMDRIGATVADCPGVRVEVKGPIVCVHYRAAPQFESVLINASDQWLPTGSGLKVQQGNHIIEVKPGKADKGRALTDMICGTFKGRTPVMIGDDTTDEDGFAAAQKSGGIGIRIGDYEKTVADFSISSIDGVYHLLDRIL